MKKLTTDTYANVGYLYTDNQQKIHQTITSSDGLLNFDVDDNGDLIGVELLSLTKFTKKFSVPLNVEHVYTTVFNEFQRVN